MQHTHCSPASIRVIVFLDLPPPQLSSGLFDEAISWSAWFSLNTYQHKRHC